MGLYYNDGNDKYKHASNHHVQLSDNLLAVGSEVHNQKRFVNFTEIKAKDNLKEDESIYIKKKLIEMK